MSKLKIEELYADIELLEDYHTENGITLNKNFKLGNVHIEIHVDEDSIPTSDIVRILKNNEDYRVIHVNDDESDLIENRIKYFTDDEILEEVSDRGLNIDLDGDAFWYFGAGRFQDFLEELEKANPIELAGISRMTLSK
jgi:hypothetical protein